MGTGGAKKAKYTVAVIGATGVGGRESLEILEERRFRLETLRLFASKRSAGESLSCQGREWTIEELTPEGPFQGIDFAFISATDAVSREYGPKRPAGESLSCQGREWTIEELPPEGPFQGIDFAFISATDAVSREYGPRLAEAGVVVIDDSAVFRMDADVPLVVPEVNAHALDSARRRIIAIPNCTTTPLVMVLKPLHEAATIKRVVVTTFQSVSGTGAAAMAELLEQTKALLSFKEVKAEVYPHQIAFNCLPHIGSVG